jgi:hypothetical protein
MHVPSIPQVLLEGTIYEICKALFWGAVMTGAIQLIVRRAFHLLKDKREIAALWAGGFILFSAMVYSLGTRPQSPALVASIQQSLLGPNTGTRDTVAILALNVINTGTMQTIVQNWRVQAFIDGQQYDGVFAQMPSTFTFNNIPRTSLNQAESITFHNVDNIVEKSVTPIQVGALLPGIIFVIFQNVPVTTFRPGTIIRVTFHDVLSKEYTAEAKIEAQLGTIGTVPGLHSELACPVPPGGPPKLGNELLTPRP